MYGQRDFPSVFEKAKWLRKMTPKLQTEMITTVVLAA